MFDECQSNGGPMLRCKCDKCACRHSSVVLFIELAPITAIECLHWACAKNCARNDKTPVQLVWNCQSTHIHGYTFCDCSPSCCFEWLQTQGTNAQVWESRSFDQSDNKMEKQTTWAREKKAQKTYQTNARSMNGGWASEGRRASKREQKCGKSPQIKWYSSIISNNNNHNDGKQQQQNHLRFSNEKWYVSIGSHKRLVFESYHL